jgi:hypothetical protein
MAAPSSAASVSPKTWLLGCTAGSRLSGTCSSFSSSWSQTLWRMSNSMVRAALLTSVACTRPPVSFHSSQLSMVPKARSPCGGGDVGAGHVVQDPADLGGREIGIHHQPGAAADGSAWPCSRSCAHSGSPRRSCQTMALWMGWPVRRFHTTVVSRWLVMPIARISRRRQAGLGNGLLRGGQLGLPDLLGVVLHPAGLRDRSGGTRAGPSRRCGRRHRRRCCASWLVPWSRASR